MNKEQYSDNIPLESEPFSRNLEGKANGKPMNESENLKLSPLNTRLAEMQATIAALAQDHCGDEVALLAILRSLESLHRQIRDELLMQSLPNNRRELARMLRDMEEMGGWPYIERMRLQVLCQHLEENSSPNTKI